MKSVIIYTYYNSPSSNYNLAFFLKREVVYRDNIDYIFVVNGFETDKSIIRDLKGPILEIGSFYSEVSERLLRFFKESMVKDTLFVERLKRHYALFKSV